MKHKKRKNKWIWGIVSFLIAVFILFPLNMVKVSASEITRECSLSIPVSVELKGNTENIEPEKFECVMEPSDDNLPAEVLFSTITLNKTGVITGRFDEIHYTKPGDYKYSVYQTKGENKNIVYDDSMYEVTVRVVNTETGSLTAEVWAVKNESEQKVDEIRFINYYNGITPSTTESKPNTTHHTTTNTITRSSIGTSSPKTGDTSNLFRWGAIAIISLTCIFLFLFVGKIRK